MEVVTASATWVGLAAAAWLITRLLRITQGAQRLVASIIVGSAIWIVLSEFLSAFTAWRSQTAMIAVLLCLVAAIGASFAVRSQRRPAERRLPRVRSLGDAVAIALLAVAGAVLAIEFWIGSQLAPGNWDSMTYHLSRIAYWMQYQRIGDYPGASIRQLGSLPNAEILQGLAIMPIRVDTYVFVPQWIALIGTAILIYVGAQLLMRNRPAGAFAATIFCLLPQPILQSTSTQNDLICAFFVLGGVVFGLIALTRNQPGAYVVAALSLAIAIGTKGTAWFAMPGLVLGALFLLLEGRTTLRRVAALVVCTGLGTAVVDGYWFAMNIANGRPFDGGVAQQTSTLSGAYGAKPDLTNVTSVVLRAVDFAGLPTDRRDHLMGWLGRFPDLIPRLNLQAQPMEDYTAFGLAGLTLLPIAVLYGLFGRSAGTNARVFAIAAASSFAIFTLLVATNPWTSRLMMFIAALAAPLIAFAWRRWWLALAALLIIAFPAWDAITHNGAKQLVVPGISVLLPLRTTDRIGQMTGQRSELSGPLHFLADNVPNDAHIGFVGGEDDWDYPLFGPRFERVIDRIPASQATLARLKEPGLAGTFWADESRPPPAYTGAIPIGGKYYWIPGRP